MWWILFQLHFISLSRKKLENFETSNLTFGHCQIIVHAILFPVRMTDTLYQKEVIDSETKRRAQLSSFLCSVKLSFCVCVHFDVLHFLFRILMRGNCPPTGTFPDFAEFSGGEFHFFCLTCLSEITGNSHIAFVSVSRSALVTQTLVTN